MQHFIDHFIDIVICIDATGSMIPYLEDTKDFAMKFCLDTFTLMEFEERELTRLRTKVIAFRNYEYGSAPMVISDFFTLPEQQHELEAFLRGIDAKGGGGNGANALEAIAYALRSDDWTTDGDKRRHIILMFTDVPALPLGAHADVSGYPSDIMPADLAQLGAWWHGHDLPTESTFQPMVGRMVAFAPRVEPWVDLEAWNYYWPFYQEGIDYLDLLECDYDFLMQLIFFGE